MRRKLDAYFTPASAVESLLKVVTIWGSVLEPCSGQGAISEALISDNRWLKTNDIDPAMPSMLHADATTPEFWQGWAENQWVVSNPPFKAATQIVKLAHAHASIGVAMLLRLSFLEPCEDRAEFLSEHPPNVLIVLPRISFTGDGKTDSVTCAWMVWNKHYAGSRIVIERKGARKAAAA